MNICAFVLIATHSLYYEYVRQNIIVNISLIRNINKKLYSKLYNSDSIY